jgi:uncharacterized protein YdaU (DUF1376 family)
MAKDPAFLFYPNDFDAATKFFSHEQVGAYIRLLIAQFQHGRLTQKQFLHIAGCDDPELMAKFKTDEEGKFYNERLESEISKRKRFSESRRKNVQNRYKTDTSVATSVATSVVHMENENENENQPEFKSTAGGFFAGADHMGLSLNDVQVGAAIQYLFVGRQVKADAKLIENLWHIFKVKEFTSKKWYPNERATYTHFMNNLRYEKIELPKGEAPKPRDDSKAKSILGI